tara:strand:+ start:433 stop:639 length:207 start_codon:yes stop_codon:yes gene_type:complete
MFRSLAKSSRMVDGTNNMAEMTKQGSAKIIKPMNTPAEVDVVGVPASVSPITHVLNKKPATAKNNPNI